MARPSGRNIRNEAVEAATTAIKRRGVTGFSYGDLAERIGVRSPSIHHHFTHKQDLVAEAVVQYRASFRVAASGIDEERALEILRSYGNSFLRPADDDELCLCGAAVAGWDDLNDKAQTEIIGFFDDEIVWVEAHVVRAIDEGDMRSDLDAYAFATAFVAALEGALLLARCRDEKARLSVLDTFLDLAST